MFRWLVPPKALFLGILLSIPGGALGVIFGSWVVGGAIALMRWDMNALALLPRTALVLPTIPGWYTGTERIIWNTGAVGSAILGGFSMAWALKLWKHLVVTKFHWMTDEEVQAFYDRDPGG